MYSLEMENHVNQPKTTRTINNEGIFYYNEAGQMRRKDGPCHISFNGMTLWSDRSITDPDVIYRNGTIAYIDGTSIINDGRITKNGQFINDLYNH